MKLLSDVLFVVLTVRRRFFSSLPRFPGNHFDPARFPINFDTPVVSVGSLPDTIGNFLLSLHAVPGWFQ